MIVERRFSDVGLIIQQHRYVEIRCAEDRSKPIDHVIWDFRPRMFESARTAMLLSY
jgi:hypothetical protein